MRKISLLLFLGILLCPIYILASYVNSDDVRNANYIAKKGIINFQSDEKKYRLESDILRQEVISMALKIKWISFPSDYICQKYFRDVIQNDWACRAIELGMKNSIISRNNTVARPHDSVTKAEALAMLMGAAGIQIDAEQCRKWKSELTDTNDWQSCVFITAYQKYLIDNVNSDLTFEPNKILKRYEVFDIWARILRYKEGKFPDLLWIWSENHDFYILFRDYRHLPDKMILGYIGPDNKIIYLHDSFPARSPDYRAFPWIKWTNTIYISWTIDDCDSSFKCTKFTSNIYEYNVVKHTWKIIFSENTTEKSEENEFYYWSMHRFIEKEGSKWIMYKIWIDSSPGPCFEPILGDNLLVFDFKNISAGMQKYSVWKELYNKHLAEQEACSRDLFGS
jgi:hypothetical protein